jgi:transcriptional regulator with XRE-family HTH domain
MTGSPPECERLAARLRALRDRSRLTLSVLATESAYSKSSWQRWLAGHALPPWPAVSALCRLAEEPEPGIRALWELAEAAWSRRTATGAARPADMTGRTPQRARSIDAVMTGKPPASGTPDASLTRRHRTWLVGAAAAAAIAVLGAGIVALLPGADRAASGATAGFHVGCTGTACDGKDPGPVLCGVEPKTLLHAQTPTGVGLEIRYNPLCRAAWARVWNAPVGSTLTFTTPGRPAQRVTVARADGTDPFVYTGLAAVAGRGSTMRACVAPPSGSAPTCYTARRP